MSTAAAVQSYLESNHFKREGREWRGNCPWRTGANSNSFAVTLDGDENGAWYDHRDNAGGSLYDFCQRVGIEVVKRETVAVHTSRRPYKDLADYAAEHGVPASAYETAGWKQVEYQNRPALKFETSGGTRWRFIDGQEPPFKHWGRNGQPYASCWYGMKNVKALLLSSGLPPVLCNGEPSVVAAQHWGLPALCVTSSGEKEIPAALLDQFAAIHPQGRVIVAMDCDDKGRAAAAKVTRQLSALGYEVDTVDLGLSAHQDLADFCKLHTEKAKTAIRTLDKLAMPDPATMDVSPEQRLAALPPVLSAEDKQAQQLSELNGTLGQLSAAVRRDASVHSPDALRAMLAQVKALTEQLEHGDGLDLMVTGEAVADMAIAQYAERKKLRDQLPGLPTGFKGLDAMIDGLMPGVNVFVGATGMGKSWTAVSIAGHLAAQGHHGMIITTEMNPKTWLNRVAAYTAQIDSGAIKRGLLTNAEEGRYSEAMNYLDQHLNFVKGVRPTAASLRATVLKERMRGRLDFVVLDSASRLINPGDNLYGETALIQNALQELALETELPMIVTGQVKGREVANRAMKMPTINDSFGGSSWEHNADVLIGLYYHTYYVKQLLADPDPQFPEGVFAMRVLKDREGEMAADKILKMKFVGGRGLYELDERKEPERYSAPRYKEVDHDAIH